MVACIRNNLKLLITEFLENPSKIFSNDARVRNKFLSCKEHGTHIYSHEVP